MCDSMFSFKPELLPDEEFDTPLGNLTRPFDADVVGWEFDQIMSGSAVRFEPEELRDWLRGLSRPSEAQALALADAVSELGGLPLNRVLRHCGGSAREMARLLRDSGRERHHWIAVTRLNNCTVRGAEPWPLDLEKLSQVGQFV